MASPKDWFRRRRQAEMEIGSTANGDPFADTLLDLGRIPPLVEMDASSPPGSLARRPDPIGSLGRAGAVPPPPPRQLDQRNSRSLDPQIFKVRPALTVTDYQRRGSRGEDSGTTALGEPPTSRFEHFNSQTNGVALRSRATLLARPVLPTAQPREEPISRQDTVAHYESAPRETVANFPVAPPMPPGPGCGASVSSEVPHFTLAAPGIPWMRNRPNGGAMQSAALREAFTPTRPKQQGSVFSGRFRQMQRIISAIEEERAHIVLYGERGSGKTSLANVIAAKAEEAGYFVAKFACSTELTFDELFRNFLRRLPASFLAEGIGATSRAGIGSFEELLPGGEIGIAELIAVLSRLHDKHAIFVIDEYDRIASSETKNKLAELIKNMSDASVPVTLLLIGVADDVDELLGKHPSLQRALVTVPLPLMGQRELEGIIATGEEKTGLAFAPEVRQKIVEFAQGLPYHAQLLGLFAARAAVRRHSPKVEIEDLRYAVQRAAEEAEGKIKEAYSLAVASQSGTSFKDVLFAAARAASDEYGTFSVLDVARAAASLGTELSMLSLQYPLKKLTEAARGGMLRRLNSLDGLRYQFASQMLRHHVVLRQAEQRGLV